MPLAPPDVPTIDVDFLDAGMPADPFSTFERVRDVGPLVVHEATGQYLLTGWRDCAKVLGDATTFASDTTLFVSLFGDYTMQTMERDRHDPVRSIWSSEFRRDSVEARRQMVTAVVDAQILPAVERLRSGETVDAVQDMTRHVPTLVIARMMGVPDGDQSQFADWSDRMGRLVQGMQDPSPRGEALVADGRRATAELNDYVRTQIADRSFAPDGLVGTMVDSPVAHDVMTDGEVVASNTQLVFAGNETTAKLMATVVMVLAERPDLRRELAADRGLVPRAVEEIHRWSSISQVTWRTARDGGATVAGHQVPEGATLMLLRAAANRDPHRWGSPDVVDVHRTVKGHLGFGFGMHSCLGLNLARFEIEVLVNRLLDELPDWEPVGVDWGPAWMLRGPVRLDVRSA